MEYDINRPWLTLDDWQEEYIFNSDVEQNQFLLAGRQSGKTTAMSMRAVILCVKYLKKGEFVLINSITEKQGFHVLAKALAYAREVHHSAVKWKGKDKPTKHIINFKNGTGIMCYAAGETGEGLRGFTIKKLMVDEGSRMSEEYFIATMPMLSVARGSIDIASTPRGKRHKDGEERFFYKCSKDDLFKKYYISAEDCPRHDKEFLKAQKERLSRLAYAQEYLAEFTDEITRIYDDEMLKAVCILKKEVINKENGNFYLGVDVAGFGKDLCTYEVLEKRQEAVYQRENITESRNYTTDTSKKIKHLNEVFNFIKIGIDDGGIGFGVYSELMNFEETKRITIPLNNSSRPLDREGKRSKKILKEEMYLNLLVMMEGSRIKLLRDDEVINSLASVQYDEDGKIFGFDSHIAEGIIRAAWLAKDKINKPWIDYI